MSAVDGEERARLFLALSLPAEVRDALARWRDDVVDAVPALRPVGSEALHVTLCFLGSRPASELPGIRAACAVAAGAPAGRLTVEEPVWLPARRPRVLAVALDDAGDALAGAQAALSRSLSRGGFYAPEARPFFAHVTVARVRKDARLRAVELPAPPRLAFAGTDVTLYRSRLGAGGARYEPLLTVTLGSEPAAADPVAVVRRFHEAQARAYASGELGAVRELLHDDVVWHVPGRSAIAGEHRGVEAVLDYLERRRAMTGSRFRVEVHGATLIGDRVVQLAGGAAERDGEPVSWETVGVFYVLGGRIAECWLVPFDLYAFDRIWS